MRIVVGLSVVMFDGEVLRAGVGVGLGASVANAEAAGLGLIEGRIANYVGAGSPRLLSKAEATSLVRAPCVRRALKLGRGASSLGTSAMSKS
jgi:hypothetical protein